MGELERAYPNELAVIGVSSPKYTAEGESDSLHHAVRRLGISHPVMNDAEFRVWTAYAVNAWPTLVFIDPAGKVIGRHAGEAHFEQLDRVMRQLVDELERHGSLDRAPSSIDVEDPTQDGEFLRYPGKVLAADERIFIADSGHNRVLELTREARLLRSFGSGEPGLLDGPPDTARFHSPQGMALHAESETLYVADAENHAVRAIDLTSGSVKIAAGTGAQARRVVRRGPGLDTDLSSPWDLVTDGERLFIAMAGLHQIWSMDLRSSVVGVWAGTGHEAIRDGTREQAWLAQPMGLDMDADALYVSCAETQAIRRIGFSSGMVETLAGRGLFDFGDADGPVNEALFQHNQDVAVQGEQVLVADTYNNKIKSVAGGAAATLAGSGTAGLLDGPGTNARFSEPSGLSLDGDELFIADTNNHAVRVLDLTSGHVRTLEVQSNHT